nr:MAG: hypothetical protein [Partitiviridae sp.]
MSYPPNKRGDSRRERLAPTTTEDPQSSSAGVSTLERSGGEARPSQQPEGPPTGRGFGRGQRGTSSKGSGRRPGSRAVPAPAPVASGGGGPPSRPPPLHLSKTGSAQTNDRLWKEAFFPDPAFEAKPSPAPNYFHPGADGLIQVVSEVYTTIKAQQPAFARAVPQSALAYYSGVVLYARMLHIHAANGFQTSRDEDAFVQRVSEGRYPLPEPITDFIMGFGNVTLLSGAYVQFQLLPRQYQQAGGLPGWFGRVGSQTHYLYKSYPCLAVFARRIQEDIAASRRAAHAVGWDLPEEIQPAEAEHGLPTPNLLGYARAVQYRQEVVTFLTSTGVEEDSFPSVNASVPFCVELMNAVAQELANTTAFRLTSIIYDAQGSQAQIPWECSAPGAHQAVKGLATILTGDLTVKTGERVDGRFTTAGAVFLYRLKNEPTFRAADTKPTPPTAPASDASSEDWARYGRAAAQYAAQEAAHPAPVDIPVHWWCPYSFADYELVPPGWIETRNKLRNGELLELQAETFVTTAYTLAVRLPHVLNAYRRTK